MNDDSKHESQDRAEGHKNKELLSSQHITSLLQPKVTDNHDEHSNNKMSDEQEHPMSLHYALHQQDSQQPQHTQPQQHQHSQQFNTISQHVVTNQQQNHTQHNSQQQVSQQHANTQQQHANTNQHQQPTTQLFPGYQNQQFQSQSN